MKRFLFHAAIGVLAIRLVWMYVVPGWSRMTTDFPNYYASAWAVRHGEPLMDLYDSSWFDAMKEKAGIPHQLALFTFYPPITALLAWPVATLSPAAAKQVWTIVNLAALVFAIVFVARRIEAPVLDVLLMALLGLDSLGNNFIFGQIYIVVALLMAAAMSLNGRSPGVAGASAAAAAVTKIFPGLIVVYFAVARRRRALAWAAAASLLFGALGLLFLGWAPHRVFLDEVLPRVMRGEILDPYNVRFNSLMTLLRRALVPEAELNPYPIFSAPALFFFLRPAVTLTVLAITFLTLRRNAGVEPKAGPLVELGAITAAATLIAPGLGTHHYFVLFPGVAAAVDHWKDSRVRFLFAGLFALICSNWMGAGQKFDAGWPMLLAFPRPFLMLLLWAAFLWTLGVLKVPLRPMAIGIGLSTALAGVAAAGDIPRWDRDERDGALMVEAKGTGLRTFPTVAESGLVDALFVEDAFRHPSAFGKGLVYELHGTISGHLANGKAFAWSGATEPALGPAGIVAIQRDERGWVLAERSDGDAGWREILRRSSVIHDPAVSFDDGRIAFAEWVEGHYRITEWNRQSRTTRTLVSGSGDYRYPAYSPSDRWFFFSENVAGNWDIVRLSLKDGRRELQTSSDANDLMPAVSPDEQTLYFASDRRRGFRYTTIYRLALR